MLGAYYYTCLTKSQKETYKTILNGLTTYAHTIELAQPSSDGVTPMYSFVTLDNPLVFQSAAFTQINHSYGRSVIKPIYKFPQITARDYYERVMKYLTQFDIVKGKDDATKEKFVHDHCLGNFTYDRERGEHAYSVLGLVLHNTAVCEGIAKFVKLALDYLQVKSLVVTGKATNPVSGVTENHAWNIVKIDGQTYHLDVTFDMCISRNLYRYDYFNLSDEEILADHEIFGNVPKCSARGKDYYSLNKQVVGGPKSLKKFFREKILAREKDIVFKVANTQGAGDITDKVLLIISEVIGEVSVGRTNVEMIPNIKQNVYQITLT